METPLVGTVTARAYGTHKKSMIYDNIVGMLPNGKSLNIKTHSPDVRIVAPRAPARVIASMAS
jgi:hypothetical protein